MVAHGRSNDETDDPITLGGVTPTNTASCPQRLWTVAGERPHAFALRQNSQAMAERLNTLDRVEAARSKIAELLAAHAEWFQTLGGDHTQALVRSELDIAVAHGRLI